MKPILDTRAAFTRANRSLFDGRAGLIDLMEEAFEGVRGAKSKNRVLTQFAEDMVLTGYYATPPGWVPGKDRLLAAPKRGIISTMARAWRKREREKGRLKAGNIDAWFKFCKVHKYDPETGAFYG